MLSSIVLAWTTGRKLLLLLVFSGSSGRSTWMMEFVAKHSLKQRLIGCSTGRRMSSSQYIHNACWVAITHPGLHDHSPSTEQRPDPGNQVNRTGSLTRWLFPAGLLLRTVSHFFRSKGLAYPTRSVAVYLETHCSIGSKRAFTTGVLDR